MIKYIGLISLVIYSILVLILIINLKERNNFIKNAFILLFFLLGICFLVYNQGIINDGLRFFIRYIYFPTSNSFVLTIFLTICILLYSLFSEKLANKFKIINYVFSSLLFVAYIVFMTLNIDMSSYNSLYSNPSLFWIRTSTRVFVIWIVIISIIKYCQFFKKKGDL